MARRNRHTQPNNLAEGKYLLSLVFLLWTFGCHIPYVAEIDDETGLISVEGNIVKGDSLQHIKISRSTALYNPSFDPVTGCVVKIVDELGNEFTFPETAEGVYSLAIPEEDLVLNRDYKITFKTSAGDLYESTYERLNPCTTVDSVYFERAKQYSSTNDEELDGIQFYLDLLGSEKDSRYYCWKLTETWEYHSSSPINYIIASEGSDMVYLDDPYEFFYCWKTRKISGLYSTSTVNLTSNQKKKIPLHFVSGNSNRLSVIYSLLVKQYSMSEGAYNYWNRTRIELEELGGFYTQQPGQVQSNLINVNDSTEKVLGYFWVSAKTEKRIFVPHPSDLRVYRPKCVLEPLGEEPQFPLFVVINGSYSYTASESCLNCLYHGGTNVKPDFWE